MMLEKRIYTALLLVGGLILALMQLSPESVSLLFLAIAAAGAWEGGSGRVVIAITAVVPRGSLPRRLSLLHEHLCTRYHL